MLSHSPFAIGPNHEGERTILRVHLFPRASSDVAETRRVVQEFAPGNLCVRKKVSVHARPSLRGV